MLADKAGKSHLRDGGIFFFAFFFNDFSVRIGLGYNWCSYIYRLNDVSF